MTVIPIHYDCDPGQDDAVALLYALGSDNIDVHSISVVGGNIDVHQCARNALQILDVAKISNIPVYIGAERPLKRKLKTLPEVFGITGMAGAEDLPDPSQIGLPIDWRLGLAPIMRSTTLVATGPLTNIAREIQRNPNFSATIDHLYIMGGCPYPEPLHGWMGNYKAPGTDDYAEYNFAVDPEAAKIVFKSGFKKITLIGLNITRSVLYNQDVNDRLRAIGTIPAKTAANILSTVGEDDIQDYAQVRKTPTDPVRAMHDVVAMAAVDKPEIFEFEIVPIRIIDDLPPSPAGQTIIDHTTFDYPSVRVATKLDCDAFLDRLVKNISGIKDD